MDLFNTIAKEEGINRRESLRVKSKLTKNQHNHRISSLVKSGLVMKKADQKYSLTAFGHIIFQVLVTLSYAMDEYWKLQAIDSLNNNIPAKEYNAIIDSLISNGKIKEVFYRTHLTRDIAKARN